MMARQEIAKTELAQRIRRVRLDAGDPARDSFAQLLGLSPKTLANYERGDTQPDAAALAAYRRTLGVDTNWLITGDADIELVSPHLKGGGMKIEVKHSTVDVRNALSEAPDRIGVVDGAATHDLEGHMIPLPFYEGVEASAGIGLMPQAHIHAEAVVSFDERFLRDKGAVPERCNVITARGDSMAPTIPDGSLLVVDHSQTQIGNGYIMVINLGDDLLVKRIHRRIDGLIELISDNQAYPRETIGAHMIDQLRVVGRVVYFCRVP